MRRRVVLLLVLCASVSTACGSAGHPSTAANQAAARRDAARLLRLVVLPAGAQRLAREPRGDAGLLGSPASIQGGTGGPVDSYRLWRLHLPFGRVLGFVRRHPPAGSATNPGQAEMGVDVPGNEESSFSFSPVGGRISSRELEVAVVALPHGWTGVRADALDGWVVTRTGAEAVPAGVREIDIRSGLRGERPRVALRVTDSAQIARIVGWINSLGVVQGGGYHCPALVPASLVMLDFRARGGALLAIAAGLYAYGGSSGPCDPLRLSIRGRAQTPLVGDFLPRVAKLLHVRFSA